MFTDCCEYFGEEICPECGFPLQQHCLEQMVPYHNDTQCITWFLKTRHNLQHEAMQVRDSRWDKVGLKAYQPMQMAAWINSHPIHSHLSQTVDEMHMSQNIPENPDVEENPHVARKRRLHGHIRAGSKGSWKTHEGVCAGCSSDLWTAEQRCSLSSRGFLINIELKPWRRWRPSSLVTRTVAWRKTERCLRSWTQPWSITHPWIWLPPKNWEYQMEILHFQMLSLLMPSAASPCCLACGRYDWRHCLINVCTAAGADGSLAIFDRYSDELSAEDHERRGGWTGATELVVNTPILVQKLWLRALWTVQPHRRCDFAGERHGPLKPTKFTKLPPADVFPDDVNMTWR